MDSSITAPSQKVKWRNLTWLFHLLERLLLISGSSPLPGLQQVIERTIFCHPALQSLYLLNGGTSMGIDTIHASLFHTVPYIYLHLSSIYVWLTPTVSGVTCLLRLAVREGTPSAIHKPFLQTLETCLSNLFTNAPTKEEAYWEVSWWHQGGSPNA